MPSWTKSEPLWKPQAATRRDQSMESISVGGTDLYPSASDAGNLESMRRKGQDTGGCWPRKDASATTAQGAAWRNRAQQILQRLRFQHPIREVGQLSEKLIGLFAAVGEPGGNGQSVGSLRPGRRNRPAARRSALRKISLGRSYNFGLAKARRGHLRSRSANGHRVRTPVMRATASFLRCTFAGIHQLWSKRAPPSRTSDRHES